MRASVTLASRAPGLHTIADPPPARKIATTRASMVGRLCASIWISALIASFNATVEMQAAVSFSSAGANLAMMLLRNLPAAHVPLHGF